MTRQSLMVVWMGCLAAVTGCRSVPVSPEKTGLTLEKTNLVERAFRTRDGREVAYQVIKERVPLAYRAYRIGPGDELELLLEDRAPEKPMDTLNSYDFQAAAQEEFAGVRFNKYRVVVDPMGNINAPLIGEIHAANVSAPELEQAVKQALLKYLVEPRVYLRIVSYASYSIYVLGEVRQPGRHEIKKPVSLSEAIALGGGITREGSIERIYVGRPGVNTQRMNLCEVWTQDGLDRELILEGEDVVFVARRSVFNLSEIEQISNIIGNMMMVYLIWE